MASSTQAPPLLFQYSVITLSLLLLGSCLHGVTATPYWVLCNHKSYDEDDPFGASLVQLLQELVSLTPWRNGDLYTALPHTSSPLAYGHATCSNSALQNHDECEACIKFAVKQILDTCGHNTVGARATLEKCMLRYEQYAFKD
ncbi:unnamed protein product [Urochloa humidicola]